MATPMDAKLLKAVCNNLERLDGTEITLTVSILWWRWTFSRNGADLKNRENSNMMVTLIEPLKTQSGVINRDECINLLMWCGIQSAVLCCV